MPDSLETAARRLLDEPPRSPTDLGELEGRAAGILRRRRRQRRAIPLVGIALIALGTQALWPADTTPDRKVETSDGGLEVTDHDPASVPGRLVPLTRSGYPENLHFVSPTTGFGLETKCDAEGDAPPSRCIVVVRRSTDGGSTWSDVDFAEVPPPSPAQLGYSLRMLDERRGWLYGGGLLATSDGGRTWTKVSDAPVVQLDAAEGVTWAASADPCGDTGCGPFRVLRADAGSTDLREVLGARPGNPVELDAVSSRVALVLTESTDVAQGRGVLHATDDGGADWWTAETPCGWRGSLTAVSASRLWLGCTDEGGGSQFPKSVHYSDDGGRTWEVRARRSPEKGADVGDIPVNGGVGQITPVSGGALVYLQSSNGGGGVLRSEDGGRTWRPTLEVRDDTAVRMFFLDGRYGWAWTTPELRQLHRTTDGGRTWTPVHPADPAGGWPVVAAGRLASPEKVAFVSPSTGFGAVVECSGGGECTVVVSRTRDGGATWTVLGEPVHLRKLSKAEGIRIVFDKEERGWIVGGTDLLHSYSGDQWSVWRAPGQVRQLRIAGPSAAPWGLAQRECGRPSCPAFVFAGHELEITPKQPPMPAGAGELRILAVDARVAFVAPEWSRPEAVLSRTEDGGKSWQTTGLPCVDENQEVHVAAQSAGRVWALCVEEGGNIAWGELYASQDGGKTWRLRAAQRPMGDVPSVGSGFSIGKHVNGLAVTPDGTLIVPSTSSDIGQILVSRDGGQSWVKTLSGDGVGNPFILDDLHWWTKWQRLDRTTDGGRTWTQLAG